MIDNRVEKNSSFCVGDIVFVKGNTFLVSRLIRWLTKSEFTHVGIVTAEGELFEIDAFKKLGIYPFDHLQYCTYRLKDGLTVEQQNHLNELFAYMPSKSRGYDWMRLISLAIELLFHKSFGYDNIYRYICSEVVDVLYQEIGIDLLPEQMNGHVSPKDLLASKQIVRIYDSASL